MEKEEIKGIIKRIDDYRFLKIRRDNLKERYESMLSLGYEVTANDRKKLLVETQHELDTIETGIKELITDIKQRYVLNPKDKALKFIVLHIEMLDMEPKQMIKQRQKINALRPIVLGPADDTDKQKEAVSIEF